MWSIPTKKYSGAIRSSWSFRDRAARGQTIIEYLLVLAVVIGIFLVIARPLLKDLTSKYQKGFKAGIFEADDTGSRFYYFPVK